MEKGERFARFHSYFRIFKNLTRIKMRKENKRGLKKKKKDLRIILELKVVVNESILYV